MKLKNYTTSVSAEKTILEIEKRLSEFGASHIMKEYKDGLVIGIAFRLDDQGYKLPANIEGVCNSIYETEITKSKYEQGYRVAWRVIKDWIHSQLSIIVSGQAETKEVFLPYMWDGKKTLYSAYKEGTLQIDHKEDDIHG